MSILSGALQLLGSLNQIKTEFIEIGKRLYDKGFVPGSSGNISFKAQNEILVTASGCCLGELTEDDIITVDPDGNLPGRHGKPSSERFMHTEIYKRRPGINCIIHAHPPKSTALSVAGVDLKAPLIAEAVVTMGEIPLIQYQTPSTLELATLIADNFIDHDAVLMANHGATVCGKGLKKTFYKLETLEFLSEIYIITAMLNNRNEIPQEKIGELLKIREKMES